MQTHHLFVPGAPTTPIASAESFDGIASAMRTIGPEDELDAFVVVAFDEDPPHVQRFVLVDGQAFAAGRPETPDSYVVAARESLDDVTLAELESLDDAQLRAERAAQRAAHARFGELPAASREIASDVYSALSDQQRMIDVVLAARVALDELESGRDDAAGLARTRLRAAFGSVL